MPKGPIKASHFSKDAQDLLRLFHHHTVRFLLIGGEAVIFYGYPRFTGNIDCWFDNDIENSRHLFKALQDFWGGAVPAIGSANDLTEPGMVFQFGRPPNRIDLLSTVDGVEFEPAWERREQTYWVDAKQEFPIAFIGLTDLIASKRAAGRHKDLEDLKYLERIETD